MGEDAVAAVGPLIVERERELEGLARALNGGGAGAAATVLFAGEPGLGKTHLLRSVQASAHLVLRGYSLEADAPPYFAFRRAFARLGPGDVPVVSSQATTVLAAVGVLAADDAGTEGYPQPDRLAVQDALTELLLAMARVRQVVLVLDDMQWASAAVWDAIAYIVRAAEGARLAVVLACRPEGIEPPNPGAAAVSELTRNGLLRLFTLRPLTAEGIARVVSHTFEAPAAAELVSALAVRTGGNPFFLEEVLRGLEESGRIVRTEGALQLAGASSTIAVPETLRLAVWQRIARLPEATVEALQAAATLGRGFDVETVARMLAQPQEWVIGRLKPAARARIVTEEAPGRWAFAHDTLRDAVFEQRGDRAAALHRLAAAALEAAHPESQPLDVAAAIASHLRRAGDHAGALAASLRASRVALASHAADEAVKLAVAAEDLHRENSGPAPDQAIEVHRAVAEAADTAADYATAERGWRALLDLTVGPRERAQVLVRLATSARKAERSDAAAEYFREALALLDEGDDVETLVEALVELSTLEGTTRSEYEAATAHGERALALAREAGHAGLEARAALALANARTRADTPVAGREMLALALEKALAVNDLVVAAEASASLSNSYYWTGELRPALVYAERRLEIAERGRDAFALRHAYSWLAMLATSKGDWGRAQDMLRLAEPAIARMGSPEPLGFLRVVEGLLALRMGDFERALARSEDAMRILTPLGEATVSWYVSIRLLALLWGGRREEAARECEAQEARLRSMPDSALPARSARCGLGRVYVALGDRDRALECEQRLAPFADDFHWRPARLTLAATAMLRGDKAGALGLLREVEDLETRNGLEFDLQDTRRTIALLESGATAEVAFGPEAAAAMPAKPADTALPGGLSRREVEVLQLVAQGLSNRDIAERLVLSERTVVNHISHIFQKIGVENRAGATAFAFTSGLATQD